MKNRVVIFCCPMALPFAVSYYDLRLKADQLYASGGLEKVSLLLKGGEVVSLAGPRPAADRLFLEVLAGRRVAEAGTIWVAHQESWLNLTELSDRERQPVYHQTIGCLGPLERPQTVALDYVASALTQAGVKPRQADRRTREVLDWLGIPRRWWGDPVANLKPPLQEQLQLARAFAVDYRVIVVVADLASLNPASRDRTLQLIEHRRRQGTSFIGRFGGEKIRCDRQIELAPS